MVVAGTSSLIVEVELNQIQKLSKDQNLGGFVRSVAVGSFSEMHPGIAFSLAAEQSRGNVGPSLHYKLEHILAKSLITWRTTPDEKINSIPSENNCF